MQHNVSIAFRTCPSIKAATTGSAPLPSNSISGFTSSKSVPHIPQLERVGGQNTFLPLAGQCVPPPVPTVGRRKRCGQSERDFAKTALSGKFDFSLPVSSIHRRLRWHSKKSNFDRVGSSSAASPAVSNTRRWLLRSNISGHRQRTSAPRHGS